MDLGTVQQSVDENEGDLKKTTRVQCEICFRKFSATKKSRQPLVGKCGHTFCKFCTRRLRGKCARCRTPIEPKTNFTLIDSLEQIRELKESVRAMKEQMKKAGLPVEEEKEESEESAEEEEELEDEGVEQDVDEDRLEDDDLEMPEDFEFDDGPEDEEQAVIAEEQYNVVQNDHVYFQPVPIRDHPLNEPAVGPDDSNYNYTPDDMAVEMWIAPARRSMPYVHEDEEIDGDGEFEEEEHGILEFLMNGGMQAHVRRNNEDMETAAETEVDLEDQEEFNEVAEDDEPEVIVMGNDEAPPPPPHESHLLQFVNQLLQFQAVGNQEIQEILRNDPVNAQLHELVVQNMNDLQELYIRLTQPAGNRTGNDN